MIISHQYRFIFIKTKKTAGTSIEIALSGICGPDDVITPITPKYEEVRRALGFRGPQNFTRPDGRAFFNHISADVVRHVVGDAIWRDYYTFCFERNPWDKVMSWYYWLLQFSPHMSLDDFIASGDFAGVGGIGGYDLYTKNDKIIVDRICRYESLTTELSALAAHLGIAALPALPNTKSEYRRDKRHYRDLLTPSQRDRIAAAFQREIRNHGYEY